ncbi:MAG: hypothetical protein IKW03_05595 [Clostridia bacterium]|nr:hypothetical protein [Clostridia bacterium]
MEPLFKCTNSITEKRAREIYRNISLRYHIFYLIMFLIAVSYNIYWTYYTYEISLIYVGLLIFVVIGYIIRPYTYARARIREYNRLFCSHEIWETYFYEDCFIDKNIQSKEELKIEYERIASVKKTKNYYVFSIRNSKTKFFVSNSIESLQEQTEFINFINNKMVNSKNKIN